MKRLFWFALIMAAAGIPLTAQNAPEQASSGTTVFAPFVSRFQGEIRNNLVRLSWIDSPDVRGPVYIYRSNRPFEGSQAFPGTRPIEIPYGIQSFVDEIETEGIFYYFAAASDETGRSFDIPIAFTNTISISISPGTAAPAAIIPVTEPASIARTPVPPAGISSLKAVVQGDAVLITFNEANVRSASLYRSIRPISQTADLLGAVIIQTKITSPFTDYPVPGIPYYYAVVAEEDLVRGTVEIIPGRNATGFPVEAGAKRPDTGRELRSMPLPQISAQAAIPGTIEYTGAPMQTELSPQAAKALGNLPARQALSKKPRVFARDLEASPAGGEEFVLASIVKGPFTAKKWEAAKEELVRFLALPRSQEVKTRAKFYLGQCYYFLSTPREGIFEFLAIQDRYPLEAAEWIKASLELMKD